MPTPSQTYGRIIGLYIGIFRLANVYTTSNGLGLFIHTSSYLPPLICTDIFQVFSDRQKEDFSILAGADHSNSLQTRCFYFYFFSFSSLSVSARARSISAKSSTDKHVHLHGLNLFSPQHAMKDEETLLNLAGPDWG